MNDKSARTYLIAIVLLSVFLRLGIALYLGDTVPPRSDELSYSTLAARLAAGHGYSFPIGWYPFTPADAPTAHWSFLYTAFVGAVYAAFGPRPLAARLVQAVFAGLLLPWLTWRLAGRLQVEGSRLQVQVARLKTENGGSKTNLQPSTFNLQTIVPLLAALLSAIYAYFVLYGAMVQTEAFYICALLWSLERTLALQWRMADGGWRMADGEGQRAILLGLSLGVATLLRQSILPWVVVLFAWLLWQALGLKVAGWKVTASHSWRSTPLAALLVAGLVLLGCIAPFTIRNYIAYDNFLLLNSNAGYAMYSAQHPMHGTSFQEFTAAPLPDDLVERGLNEAQWDKELMRRGIGFILAEPGRYLLLSLSRVRDYFEFWPTADSSLLFNLGRVASFGIFLPFMLYGLFLEIKAKVKDRGGYFSASALTLTLAFVSFYSALHIATWAMSRYRLPVDAVLLVFAAVGIASIAGRWTARQQ